MGRFYKEEGEALISTVLFDNECDVIHDRINLRTISPMTEKEYFIRGSTAILDAVETAGNFGIDAAHAVDYRADSIGTEICYRVLEEAVSDIRKLKPLRADWKEAIEEDFEARK